MASDVNDLSIAYEEDGVVLVKEIDKVVLSKGAWATVIFRYQQLGRKTNEYGPDKYSIRRYQKRSGEYLPKNKFNISSVSQAEKIVDALQNWIKQNLVKLMCNNDFTISQIMQPHEANPIGNIHGGIIMNYIDNAAAVVATRYAKGIAVTVSVDRLDFFHPVYVGNLLMQRYRKC